MWNLLIGPIASVVEKAIDRVFPDPVEAAKAKAEFLRDVMSNGETYFKEASATIRAEAASESWLARSWRPVTMLSFVAIIVNNFIIAPYAAWVGYPVPTLVLPPDMWTLLTVGIGGYVTGRSVEKAAKHWKGGE